MCGIVGYTGSRPGAALVLEGLKRLEYRGYDSAGLAVVSDGRIEVFAIGAEGAVWHRWQTAPNGPFADWDSLGGDGSSRATREGPLAAARGTCFPGVLVWMDAL